MSRIGLVAFVLAVVVVGIAPAVAEQPRLPSGRSEPNLPPPITFLEASGETYSDIGYSLWPTSDGGLVVAGTTDDMGPDALLMKFDGGGNLQWTRTTVDELDEFAYSVQQTRDGGFVVTGEQKFPFAVESTLFILRYDNSGDLTWTRSIGRNFVDFFRADSIWETADEGLVVAGSTKASESSSWEALLLRHDTAGDLIWARTLGAELGAFTESVLQTNDDGFVMAGSTINEQLTYNAFLVKLEVGGSMIWARSVGGTEDDWLQSVQQTRDGGFIAAGTTDNGGAEDQDLLLMKFDAAGNQVWARTAGGSGNDWAKSVSETTDGGYVAVGSTSSFGAAQLDVFIVKFDAFGSLLWARMVGGPAIDRGYSIQQTIDGAYAIAGYTLSYGVYHRSVLLLKIDSEGNIPGCSAVSEVIPVVTTPDFSSNDPVVQVSVPDILVGRPVLTTNESFPPTTSECRSGP